LDKPEDKLHVSELIDESLIYEKVPLEQRDKGVQDDFWKKNKNKKDKRIINLGGDIILLFIFMYFVLFFYLIFFL
jgi:hypothetical protein